MANPIAYTKNYTAVLDEVYKRATCSTVFDSLRIAGLSAVGFRE